MMMVEEALRCPHTFSDSRELASLLTKSIPWAGVGSVQFETDRGYCSLHWPMNGTGGGKRILTTPPVTTVRQNLLSVSMKYITDINGFGMGDFI